MALSALLDFAWACLKSGDTEIHCTANATLGSLFLSGKKAKEAGGLKRLSRKPQAGEKYIDLAWQEYVK